jgi:hypothetical protein
MPGKNAQKLRRRIVPDKERQEPRRQQVPGKEAKLIRTEIKWRTGNGGLAPWALSQWKRSPAEEAFTSLEAQ